MDNQTLKLEQGRAIVGGQSILLDGSSISILKLALALAEGGPFPGRAGEASTEARSARQRGLDAEARAAEFAVHVWQIAWRFTTKSRCPIRDHDVRSATHALIRLGDSVEDRELWHKANRSPRRWDSSKFCEAIANAIHGSKLWLADADGGDTMRDAVSGLSEDRQWYLYDSALPSLTKALTTLREDAEQLIVEAYENGRRDGSNILGRLATGDASSSDFDGARR